jgi:RimJ/RimL family protein N-acetyltransferase
MTDYPALTEQLERVFTSRLALRPLALSDAWPLFQATRNPDFNKHLLWEQPENESFVLDRINTTVDAARRGRLAAMSAVLKTTGEWVSLYRFQPSSREPGAVEMGIWTSDKFWNGRFSLELTRACIDAAFTLSDVSSLIGGASPHNAPSCKLLEYCGLVPFSMGIRHSETFVEVLAQEFQITRQQWLEKRLEIAFEQVPFDDIAQPSKVEPQRSARDGFLAPKQPAAIRPHPAEPHDSAFASA